jgi:predicted RNase H-like HicB family nuclease
MSQYAFPAIFHWNKDDDSFTITFPDFPGCISEGHTMKESVCNAQLALLQWINYQKDRGHRIPMATGRRDIKTVGVDFVCIINVLV